MNYLVLLNTLAIIYILFLKDKYYISVDKETTFYKKTLLGYRIYLMERTSEYSSSSVFSINIPLKNAKKIELKEEIENLKTSNNKKYTLRAKFSWIKTWDKVKEFERNYSCVDENLVNELVNDFKIKNNVG